MSYTYTPLKSIKLAGFKSFVDPTVITLHSNLTSVVGPNGCGKSNVVDAIRWVIGEQKISSLRSENLEALVEELTKEGVTVVDKIESYDYGKFVHILDAEGNKIELWEPID